MTEKITVKIPCGKSFLEGKIKKENYSGMYCSRLPEAQQDEAEEVLRALENPIGSSRLCDMAAKAGNAVVIASDHTRPVPSKIIMPLLLQELRKKNPGLDITILIATGFHRSTTQEELIEKFGEKILREEKIVIHDSRNEKELVKIGLLPSGGELIINKLAAETDLLVSEGFIEPHFFAGFSGGRKSVLPGIASKKTVLANHCAEFIMHPRARTGILEGNPIHNDMLYAAKKAGLAFIVNVVINGNKKIVKAFAGDVEKAHKAGTDFLTQYASLAVPESDIILTGNGGYPLDQNVYQCVKGMSAGESACKEGGVIILCAACNDGHGGDSFYEKLSSSTPEELLKECAATAGNETVPDQWQYQILARILVKHKVIMVGSMCPGSLLENMGFFTAESIDAALEKAFTFCGGNGKVAVIPDGVSVIVQKVKQ